MIKNQKQQNVEIYKEILHNQIKTENYIKEQNKESNIHMDGKLLPSYIYSIPPTPIYRKAKDTFGIYKQNIEALNKLSQSNQGNQSNRSNEPDTNVNNDYSYSNQISHTEQGNMGCYTDRSRPSEKSYYLGNSDLKRNVILNPIHPTFLDNKFLINSNNNSTKNLLNLKNLKVKQFIKLNLPSLNSQNFQINSQRF